MLGRLAPNLASAASCDVVVMAVLVSALEETLRLVAPHLKLGALVLDVASIKEEPARLMDELLPHHVSIVATHPVFGPQSAAERSARLTMVVCPVRDGTWRRVAAFLRKQGLRAIATTWKIEAVAGVYSINAGRSPQSDWPSLTAGQFFWLLPPTGNIGTARSLQEVSRTPATD